MRHATAPRDRARADERAAAVRPALPLYDARDDATRVPKAR